MGEACNSETRPRVGLPDSQLLHQLPALRSQFKTHHALVALAVQTAPMNGLLLGSAQLTTRLLSDRQQPTLDRSVRVFQAAQLVCRAGCAERAAWQQAWQQAWLTAGGGMHLHGQSRLSIAQVTCDRWSDCAKALVSNSGDSMLDL